MEVIQFQEVIEVYAEQLKDENEVAPEDHTSHHSDNVFLVLWVLLLKDFKNALLDESLLEEPLLIEKHLCSYGHLLFMVEAFVNLAK